MQIDLGSPNEKQRLFLSDRHRHVGFGGARGGGKSWSVRAKAVLLAAKHAGIKIMIIRKTYPELLANHIRPLKEMLRTGMPGNPIRYNDARKEITFPNGSMILFGYCNSESDVDRYQGTEVDILFIDEATQLSEEQIKKLTACVRGVNGLPKRVYYTCNPGGKGHAYIKRIFIDRDYIGGEKADDYSFIQSKVYDNTALMTTNPEYVTELESLPEALRKAWLEGDWNAFVGQVFAEWRNDPAHHTDRQWTHVIDDFPLDDGMKVFRGFDFGYSKPFAVVWIAIDYYGRMFLFREYYGCTRQPDTGVQMEPREIARRIRAIENTDPFLKGKQIHGIADPAIWQNTTGESISDMMMHEGVYFSKGDHSRLAGLMQMHYRLRFDSMGVPMLYVFKSCTNVIRTLPILIYDEKHPEDVDTTMEDHLYDAIRYVCMENPMNPKPAEEEKPPAEDPLNLWADRYKY